VLLKLTIVAGDGFGPAVRKKRFACWKLGWRFGHDLKLTRKNIGGAPLRPATIHCRPILWQRASAQGGTAGAVGSRPSTRSRPSGPEAGLLRLRREWSLRESSAGSLLPALLENSPLRAEVVKGTDNPDRARVAGRLTSGSRLDSRRRRFPTSAEHNAGYGKRRSSGLRGWRRVGARTPAACAVGGQKERLECSRLWREVVTRVSGTMPT